MPGLLIELAGNVVNFNTVSSYLVWIEQCVGQFGSEVHGFMYDKDIRLPSSGIIPYRRDRRDGNSVERLVLLAKGTNHNITTGFGDQ